MRARLSFALAALTLLFLLQGLAVLLSASFPLVYDAVFPQFRATRLVGLALPLAALLAPALPFSLWLERRTVLLGAAAAAAIFRIPLAFGDPLVRLTLAAIVVAAGGLFLSKAVGYLERRSVAAGAAAAVLLEQVLRSAGWTWDVTLRTDWMPAQALLSAAALWIAWRWARTGVDEENETGETLERRAGGLRLRGAIALGGLLFMETAVLARPSVAARWSGASFEVLSIGLAAVGAAAVLAIIARGPIPRGRGGVSLLVAVMALATIGPHPLSLPGWAVIALIAAGHGAALLLLGRALVPAGGRRRGWTTATTLGLFFVLHALLSMTAFHGYTLSVLAGAEPWLLGMAALLVFGAILLMPRPAASMARRVGRLSTAGAIAAAAAGTALMTLPRGETPTPRTGGVVVATYNVHYGFDEGWRHDPEAIARALAATGADLIALQEVTAGLPAVYGVDLALWLGRRLGMVALYAPTAGRMVGDAVLTRLPHAAFTSTRLPDDGDPKQLAHLRIDTLGGFDFFATHLGLEADERTAQMAAIVAAIGTDPAVLAGDLNAEPGDSAFVTLRAAGFRDAFELAGAESSPTAPAIRPVRRIDWLWLRGLDATAARVVDATASDHRPVVVEITRRR